MSILTFPTGILANSAAALAFTFDGESGNNTAGSTYVYTVVGTIPAGSLAVACSGTGAVTLSSVADSKSNSWTVDKTAKNADVGAHIAHSVIGTQLTTGDTITLTFSGSTNNHAAIVGYVSNPGASPADQVGTATSGSSNTTSASTAGSTAQANEIVFGAIAINGSQTVTEDSNFTTMGDQTYGSTRRLHSAYRIVSSTGTQTYATALSGFQEWLEVIATFKGQ